MVFYYSIDSAFKPWKEYLKIKSNSKGVAIAQQSGAFKPWKVVKITVLK
jgi:hypothetical protein